MSTEQTSLVQWLQSNAAWIVLVLFAFYLFAFRKFPSIAGWQAFLDSFESKGAQLVLLWVSDFLLLWMIIHFWAMFDQILRTTIVGIMSAMNGAFLGAIGARNTSGGNGGGTPKPDTLQASLVPANGPLNGPGKGQ